jgi:hypothetical protein
MRVGDRQYDLVSLLWDTRGAPHDSPKRQRVIDLVARADELSKLELETLARYAVENKVGAPKGMRGDTRISAFNATTQVDMWAAKIEAYRNNPVLRAYYDDELPDLAERFQSPDASKQVALGMVAHALGCSEEALVKWRQKAEADSDLLAGLQRNRAAVQAWIVAMSIGDARTTSPCSP